MAKATFYSCFSSKDELILEWVRSPETRWFRDVWSEVEARTEAPAERLTQFFDVLGEWLTETDFRSWPLLATAAEITSAVRPAREELARGMADAQDHFLRAATAAGLDDPAQLAAQLFLLVTGAVTASVIAGSRQPVDAAHAAAVHLVAASTPRTPRCRIR